MELNALNVAVIGAGIGGLAVAAGLARAGASVTVYEAADALTEVGAGIQISANGQRALAALGILAPGAVPDGAVVLQGTQMRMGRAGRLVQTVAPPVAGPTWALHRADLVRMLERAARVAGAQIRLGQRVESGGVEADLVVAADGAQSVWRAHVSGKGAPRFTRQVAWRAVVPSARAAFAHPPMARLHMGSGGHVVSYPLRGGDLINLVAIEARRDWREEGWSRKGAREDFRRRFARFDRATGGLIGAAEDLHLWALHLRPVATQWARGNIVLLGDAAHPTLPFMAQGACLALEDAAELVRVLGASSDRLEETLGVYQRTRLPRARKVVQVAGANAWRFHLPWPLSLGSEAVLRLSGDALARRLAWLYDWEPSA